jgi:uncharacterized membrane protein YhaH (DUF805 family)
MENLCTMKGRTTRGQYFALFGISLVMQFLAVLLASAVPLLGMVLGYGAWGFGLMAAARRSQDCGRSGWLVLIPFYPIWLFFEPGQVGDNRFGPDPRKPVVTRPLV